MSQYNYYSDNPYSSSNYTLSSSPPTDGGMWDKGASRPRSANDANANNTAPSKSVCGIVVLPDYSSIWVSNKEAYFATNPAARASTEASLHDFAAYYASRELRIENEARVQAEKRAKQEREDDEDGLHGCVSGKKVATCGECAGNGCANGLSKRKECEGVCEECEGNGFTMTECKICVEKKKAVREKGKNCGGWKKGGAQGPLCVSD